MAILRMQVLECGDEIAALTLIAPGKVE